MKSEDHNSRISESEWERQRKKDSYLAWGLIKSALQVSASQQALQNLVSSLHDENMSMPLSVRAIRSMPDFAYLDICAYIDSVGKRSPSLNKKTAILPVHDLLPQDQFKSTSNLTWIKVLHYYYCLVQRCVWHKTSLHVPDCEWGLHYHSATADLHLKAKVMCTYLSNHCTPFRTSCAIHPLPRFLVQHSGQVHKTASHNPTKPEQHLIAGEKELSLLWHGDPLPLLLHQEVGCSVPASERVTGYFAFNICAVPSPVTTSLHSLSMEVHVVHTSLSELSRVHQMWVDLEESCQTLMLHKQVGRSASTSSKGTELIQPSEQLVKQMDDAVSGIAALLKVEVKPVSALVASALNSCEHNMSSILCAYNYAWTPLDPCSTPSLLFTPAVTCAGPPGSATHSQGSRAICAAASESGHHIRFL